MARPSQAPVRIAFYLLGTFIAVVCLFVAVLVFRRAPPPPSMTELHARWRQTVAQEVGPLLQRTPSMQEISAAKDRVLALTVTGDDRDAHLALVMALLAWQRNDPDAKAAVQRAYDLTQQ